MGDITSTALDPRAQPLAIRPAATAAVRAADPTKERFQVGERKVDKQESGAVEQDQSQAFTVESDESGVFQNTAVTGRTGRGGRGLLGAFTSFLAKMFTQSDAAGATGTAERMNGIGAYGRANSQQQNANPLGGLIADVQAPGLPRLASGRVLDLSV